MAPGVKWRGGMSRHALTFLALINLAACGPSGPGGDGPDGLVAQTVSADGYLDKVTVGYQGWFAAPGDGSRLGEWVHWSRSTAPGPANVTVELYPDTREYEAQDLFETSLGALGDGRPASLFSSHSQRVVDLHFTWMRDNGIDGVGLQRFVSTLADARHRDFRNDVTRMVRGAAERTGRVFYVEYDISGANDATWAQDLERDWADTLVGTLHVTDSPQYLRHGGKPVVAVWGLGFPDRPGSVQQASALLEWLRSRGCYVVGGVPYGWRTGSSTRPGFIDVFKRLDVIQPWAVGALATEADAERHRQDFIEPDQRAAASYGVAYQRVLFPGFAWSNWNGGPRNQIPRLAGRFFWAQAYAAKQAGAAAFIAMFDEYDEGTAIAKVAEDASMTPSSQYFLTLDADGTRVSSDFYLRLAGAATKMLKGQAPLAREVPIPPYVGGTPPPTTPNPTPTPTPTAGVPKQDAMTERTVATFTDARAIVVVQRLYRAVLGREVDSSGLSTYTPLVKQGQLPRVVNAMVTCSEFEARRPSLGTTSAWSEVLYQKVLDRSADSGGLTATSDAVARAQAANRLVEMVLSSEYASKNQ